MTDSLLDALGSDTPDTPPVAPAIGEGAPVDVGAVEAIRSRTDTPKRGPGRPRKDPLADGEKPKSHKRKAETPPQPAPPTLDPATMEALKGSLVEAWQLALSLLAVAPVRFTDEERPAIGGAMVACIELYLPDGFSKHVPAFVLVGLSLQAVARGRAEAGKGGPVGRPATSNKK